MLRTSRVVDALASVQCALHQAVASTWASLRESARSEDCGVEPLIELAELELDEDVAWMVARDSHAPSAAARCVAPTLGAVDFGAERISR